MPTSSSPAEGERLRLQSLRVFRSAEDDRAVVEALSLTVEPGARLALVGPNGAGKTSLLLALVGAVPFEGEIWVGDQRLERRSLAEVRRRVGLVFADPRDQLFLPSAREELEFGPVQQRLPRAEVSARVARALAAVGLQGFEERAPARLSLGEQRRLAIGAILTCCPSVLLLDEPTANLDPRARRQVLAVLGSIAATVVFATHDLDAALELGCDVALLCEGRLIGTGRADRLLADPVALEAAGLELPLSIAGRMAPGRLR